MVQRWSRDARNAPMLAVVFVLVLGWSVVLTADRLGLLTPGPPLDVELSARIDGQGNALFVSQGVKLTDRALVAQTASWMFSDGTALPVPSERIGTTAPMAVRQEGERFTSAAYRVPILEAVGADAGAALRVCWVYDGLPPFCREVAFTAMAGGGPQAP